MSYIATHKIGQNNSKVIKLENKTKTRSNFGRFQTLTSL